MNAWSHLGIVGGLLQIARQILHGAFEKTAACRGANSHHLSLEPKRRYRLFP